jgi:hypothetical protein
VIACSAALANPHQHNAAAALSVRAPLANEQLGKQCAQQHLCCGWLWCLQGHAFAFDQASVRIQPPSAVPPEGLIEFTGAWRGDGQRYQVRPRLGGTPRINSYSQSAQSAACLTGPISLRDRGYSMEAVWRLD